MQKNQIRFKFTKIGEYKYLSHLNIINIIIRALARAEIGLAYSQGFNPKPKINFSPPTPLGVESLAEYSDVTLDADIQADDFKHKLNPQLPKQMRIRESKKVEGKIKSLMADIGVVLYTFELGLSEEPEKLIEAAISNAGDIRNSIYQVNMEKGKDNFSLLKLYGYAKIFKNQNNSIFKYNYFYDYFKGIAIKYNINIKSIVKEEMFVKRDGSLFSPMETV